MKTNLFRPLTLLLLCPLFAVAQTNEKIDTAILAKIKKEGMKNSQVMHTLSMITDVYGPRLTGSPGYAKAAEWAKNTLTSYGVSDVHYDTWTDDFGKGWFLKKYSLQEIAPVFSPVISYPKAWSPGIVGTVQAEAVYLDVKTIAELEKYAGKLKGKIVLFNAPVSVKPGFKADAERYDDSTLLHMANAHPADPNAQGFNGPPRSGAFMDAQKFNYAKWTLCMKEGALAVLEASTANQLEDGTLSVSGATVPVDPTDPSMTFATRPRPWNATAPKILPQIVVAVEYYNRMVRQLQEKFPVKLELSFDAEFTPVSKRFNVIGEIPGTDLKDEVVMIGAHFDSWHSATGATDNGAGSAVMIEAMRIIKTLGISPRRTIRIGLWDGEEQGLIGSRSYVKRTLGERLDKKAPYEPDSLKLKPAAAKFSVYLNMDNGTGKYRGVYLQGNENVRPIFRQWLKPFETMGASTLTAENTGGTDHLAFDAIGLPGFQFIQDPIEYDTRTHHTSMDVYDKVIDADMKQNAVMTAVFAWLAANREGMIPRK